MGVLYIISAERAAGKTAVCAGLAINLLNEGKKVGYLKPLSAEKGADAEAEADVAFMKKVLVTEDTVNAPDLIKGRDVVLVEGATGEKPGDAASKAVYAAVRETKAKAIAVEAYTGQPSKYIDVYKGFGDSFLGIVLNKVPAGQLKDVKAKATALFSAAGIKMLGVIPESRVLMAITVGELADVVKGKILNNGEKSNELVENFMLGAMVVGSGIPYFERKSRKAAIIHQDRPDMQLAALETPTACLVLTGSDQPPIYNVLHKATSRGVPVISTLASTYDTIGGLEEALLQARLLQEKKLPGLAEIVKRNLDMKAVV